MCSNFQQLVHYLEARHVLQCVEGNVAELVMAPPCVVIMSSGKADGARDIEAQHVQMIGVTPHLGEEPLLPIPNAKHNIVDVDRGAILIKLAKAHDAVTEPRNVIKMLDVVVRSSKEHLRARLFEVHTLRGHQEHTNMCHKKCGLLVIPIS
jgi:hypothetical protein